MPFLLPPHFPKKRLVLPTHFFREAPSPGTLASAPLRTSAAKCRAANGASGPAAPLRPPEHPAATASDLHCTWHASFPPDARACDSLPPQSDQKLGAKDAKKIIASVQALYGEEAS